MPSAMRLADTSSSNSFSDAARLLMLLATNRAALFLDCTQLRLSAICIGKPPNGTVHITEYRHALVMLHPDLLPRSFVNARLRNHVGLHDWGNNPSFYISKSVNSSYPTYGRVHMRTASKLSRRGAAVPFASAHGTSEALQTGEQGTLEPGLFEAETAV